MMRSTDVELLEERIGDGPAARLGDRLIDNCRMFLHRGDEVPMNERQAANLPSHLLRAEGGVTLVDHQAESGKRQVIPGIERALPGMKTGGDCKIRIGLHMAYGYKGLPSLIPPHALLVVALGLRDIVQTWLKRTPQDVHLTESFTRSNVGRSSEK